MSVDGRAHAREGTHKASRFTGHRRRSIGVAAGRLSTERERRRSAPRTRAGDGEGGPRGAGRLRPAFAERRPPGQAVASSRRRLLGGLRLAASSVSSSKTCSSTVASISASWPAPISSATASPASAAAASASSVSTSPSPSASGSPVRKARAAAASRDSSCSSGVPSSGPLGGDAPSLGPGPGRDELADDHVLLQAEQVVLGAVDRRLGEHPRRLLEAGRRQERARVERRLRDAQQDRLRRRRLAALGEDPVVRLLELEAVDELGRAAARCRPRSRPSPCAASAAR